LNVVRLHSNALERRKQRADYELHKDAKEALECLKKVEMNEVSRSLTANRNMGEFSNYGEKLYMEEKIRREKREKELELIKKMREEEELKNLTFQPNISETAKNLYRGNVFDRMQEVISQKKRKEFRI